METLGVAAELRDAERAEAGRALGYEMAALGMPLGNGMPTEISEGYAEGRHALKRFKRMASTFEKKLLRLKVSAWRRGRFVDDAVTPGFLESIARTHCPIRRIVMTTGTGTGSDMTVDRVFNGGAYAVGNIAFMSAAANHAKGSMMPMEIVEIAKKCVAFDGLTSEEWMRLACMTCQATPPGYPITNLPMFVFPPNGLLISNGYVVLQQQLTLLAAGFVPTKWLAELRLCARGKKAKRALDDLLMVLAQTSRAELTKARSEEEREFALCDAWLPPLVFERYLSLVRELSGEETRAMVACAKRADGNYRSMTDKDIATWGLERGGYQ